METGNNRFFNICEAYQSMLGKSDSVASDARRYRNINESFERMNEDFGAYQKSIRPEIGFEETFRKCFNDDIYYMIYNLWGSMSKSSYWNRDAHGIVVNKRVITWLSQPDHDISPRMVKQLTGSSAA